MWALLLPQEHGKQGQEHGKQVLEHDMQERL